MEKRFNLANFLTNIRMFIFIPIFIGVSLLSLKTTYTVMGIENSVRYGILALIFITASLTDFVDGWWARKYKMVSVYGKVMDPLADKMLVLSALMVLMIDMPWMLIPTVLILSREFLIMGIRVVSAGEGGNVIAAQMLGKIKTTTQMLAIIFYLLGITLLGHIFISIAVIFTYWSLYDYVKGVQFSK